MRIFASSSPRLRNLPLEARVVYTAFSLLSLLGLVVTALLYEDMVGARLDGVRAYYAGDEAGAPAPPPAPATAAGPRIELPDEVPAAAPVAGPRRLVVAVTYRKLLEVTHFHLFTVPVFLMVVSHLFMLTGLSQRRKLRWIVGGWIGGTLHLAAPWAVRYGGAEWAWLYALSGALLAVCSTVMTLVPAWAMWVGPAPARASALE